jgi:predicted anti-sigma-YlaC factor YlaD
LLAIRKVQFIKLLKLFLAVIAFYGCSIQRTVTNHLGEAISQTGGTYASDDDLELIGSAAPFGLKLIEGMLAESPRHEGLLLAASRGFTQYAFAFVESPAQELEDHDVAAASTAHSRAQKLFMRAKDYGLRGLEVRIPGFRENLMKNPDALLGETNRKDVPLLYWTAVSWAAAISLSKENAGMLAELPMMEKLAARALELDESFDHGAIHVFFINLAMNLPLPESKRMAQARSHFNRALELSSGHQASPFVTYAEVVSVPARNREEFKLMLEKALQVDASSPSSSRMSNELFQRKARWLNSHIDNFFAE